MNSRGGSGAAPRTRPTIGITPDVTEKNGFSYYELKAPYADAVTKAGGLPFVLPYSTDAQDVKLYLDRISGLVVTGGAFDIPPSMYGEEAKQGLGELKPTRTSFEQGLMQGALERGIPVLGVCGGMQLLHVLLGGTLHQDILKEIADAKDHEQKTDKSQPSHPVEVHEGTTLAQIFGKGQLMVNSTHHQAAKSVSDRIKVSAVSPDGVIEAIEAPEYGFAVGVQWHPELLLGSMPVHLSLYKALVGKARDRRPRQEG